MAVTASITDWLQVIGFVLLISGVYNLVRATGFLNRENPFFKFYIKVGVILTPIGGIIFVMGLIFSFIKN